MSTTEQPSWSGRTVGEMSLGFDCCGRAGEFGRTLKYFTRVGIGGYASLGYFNAREDWNISVTRSARTPPSTKQDEK